MIGKNEWAWSGISNIEQGGLFSRFFVPGDYDIYAQLAVDTDLRRPDSLLHRMQFKFGIKYLPEELVNRPNATAF